MGATTDYDLPYPEGSNPPDVPARMQALAEATDTALGTKARRTLIDVRDYGATGDGVTNDTAAIQAAIDATSATVGTVIYFPPGDYRVTTLGMRSNTALVGPATPTFGLTTYLTTRCATLKQIAATTGPIIADYADIDASHAYGVRIENLALDGNKANQSASNHGIEMYDASSGQDAGWRVTNVLIQNCKGDGIHVGAFRRGLHATRCDIQLCDGNGVTLESTDNHLLSCCIGQHVGYGVEVLRGINHLMGLDVFSCETGVRIGPLAVGVMVSNCHVDLHQKDGMSIAGPFAVVSCCAFTSNGQETDATYAHISLDFPNLTALNTVLHGITMSHDAALPNKPLYGINANLKYTLSGLSYHPSAPPFTSSPVNFVTYASVATSDFGIADDVDIWLGETNGTTIGVNADQKVGFHGNKTVRQAVTGSRGGNAALASLLTALDAKGVITDSTTV